MCAGRYWSGDYEQPRGYPRSSDYTSRNRGYDGRDDRQHEHEADDRYTRAGGHRGTTIVIARAIEETVQTNTGVMIGTREIAHGDERTAGKTREEGEMKSVPAAENAGKRITAGENATLILDAAAAAVASKAKGGMEIAAVAVVADKDQEWVK